MNLQEILTIVKEMKGLVFTDDPFVKYKISELLTKQCGIQTHQGQKRVVFDGVGNDNNFVFKIGCTETGVRDNALEVAMYAALVDKANAGKITPDELILFPKSELVDNDSFVIKSERAIRFYECNEYNEYVANFRNNQMINLSDVEFWAHFIMNYKDPVSQQNILLNDYLAGLRVLSNMSIPSDITIVEPLNFGVRNIGGKLRLCFIDLGSCIPIASPKGIMDQPDPDTLPICPSCGQGRLQFMYLSSLDPAVAKINEVMHTFRGLYICSNPACANSQTATVEGYKHEKNNHTQLDMVVFGDCLNAVIGDPNRLPFYAFYLALKGGYYIPPIIGMDSQSYYNSLMGMLKSINPQVNIDNNIFHKMYENYVFKTLGVLTVNPNTPLSLFLANNQRFALIMNRQMSYETHKNEIYKALAASGIQAQNMACKIAAITYLKTLIDGYNMNNPNKLMFFNLFQMDVNNFMNSMQMLIQLYGQQDVVNLFNHLHLN